MQRTYAYAHTGIGRQDLYCLTCPALDYRARRYQICLFCYDRIKQDCGNLCPGCRTEYGTEKDPFAKLEVKKAPELAPVRTPPQREAAPAPKPPLHERQTQQAQHRQQRQSRDAGGFSKGGGAQHARGAQPSQQQNGVPPPPPPRQPLPPPPPRAPPAASGITGPKPALSRSSSTESSSATAAAAPRQRPVPGWPMAPQSEQLRGSPLSSVGSGPLPPHIALEPAASRVDGASRNAASGAVTGHAVAERRASQESASWPSLSGLAPQGAAARQHDQQQQEQQEQRQQLQQQQQERSLDPQVPPPPMLRNQSAFAPWALLHGVKQHSIAAPGSHVPGRAPGFQIEAPASPNPQQLLQAGTVQLGASLPLTGSGRAVLADPVGRNMLAALRLAVQTGRFTAEEAAQQLAGYLRSRDLGSPAVAAGQVFANVGFGSGGGSSGGLFLGAAYSEGNGQSNDLAPYSAEYGAPGSSADSTFQWHSAGEAQPPPSAQLQAGKRAGRKPLYARGSSNANQASQNGGHGGPGSGEGLSSGFVGLSLSAPSFRAGL